MASCSESVIQEEIEVLQSIYLPDELEIRGTDDRPTEILVMLHPYTAENEDGKYVCMQLVIKLDEKYPNSKPSFEFKMPRGISDAQLDSIKINLEGLASHRLGEAMLFELIEYAKECLTSNNKPECTCAICLDYFDEEDNFTRTECYHFFHDVCLARYVKSYLESCEIKVIGSSSPFEEQPAVNKDVIPCPICRTGINRDLLGKGDVDITSYKSEKIIFEPSTKFLAWRKRMKAIYLRQQKRGGIIDIEAEKNKYLIETKTVEDEEILEPIDDPRLLENEGIHILGNIDSWISESQIVEQSLSAKSANSNRTNAREQINAEKSYIDSASRPISNIVPRTDSGGRAPSPMTSKARATVFNDNSGRLSTREPIMSQKPSEDDVSRPAINKEPRTESSRRVPSPMTSKTGMSENSSTSSRTNDSASRPTNSSIPRIELDGRSTSPVPSKTRTNYTKRERERARYRQPRRTKENSSPSFRQPIDSMKSSDDSAGRPTNNNEPRTGPGRKAPSPKPSQTRTNDTKRERERAGYRQPRRTKENSSPSFREPIESVDSSRVSNRRTGQFTEKSTAGDRETGSDKSRTFSTANQERSKAETKSPVRPPPGFKPLS